MITKIKIKIKIKNSETQPVIKHLLVFVLLLLLFGVFPLIAVAQPGGGESAVLYVDKLNGFSILPPEGAVLNPQKSPQTIVEWLCCDPKTKAVKWSLRVLSVTTNGSDSSVESFAKTFAGELAARENTTVTDKEIVKISGRGAIAISGTKGGKADGPADKKTDNKKPEIYFRRLWVLTALEKVEVDMGKSEKTPVAGENQKSKVTLVNAEFLLFELVAPLTNKDAAAAVWEKAISSLKILDVEETLSQLRDNSERAKVFLQNLWDSNTLESVTAEPSWYLVFSDGKPVGWVMMQGKMVRRNHVDGFELRLCSMRSEPGKKVLLARQRLFVDPKGQGGFWRIYSQVGDGGDSIFSSEEGLLRGNKIVCNIFNGDSLEVREKDVPGEVRDILLPKAIGLLLPLLVDPDKQVGYTFAEYSSGKNTFNMRSFTVYAPEWIDIVGKRTLAVKVTDQPYPEAAPSQLWLGKGGTILRCRSANSIIESATPQQVLSCFPKANLYVKAINKLGKKKK